MRASAGALLRGRDTARTFRLWDELTANVDPWMGRQEDKPAPLRIGCATQRRSLLVQDEEIVQDFRAGQRPGYEAKAQT